MSPLRPVDAQTLDVLFKRIAERGRKVRTQVQALKPEKAKEEETKDEK